MRSHGRLLLAALISLGLWAAPVALGASLVPEMGTRPLPTSGNPVINDTGIGKQLAFSNEWGNSGAGPWETAPVGSGASDDCDGDGVASNDVVVIERIYDDANGDSVFERGIDAGSTAYPAGCMIFHPAHDHFHVEDVGRYSLLREPLGIPAGAAHKVSFCLLDIAPFNTSLPGAPQSSYYDGCSQAVQGISVGWYDQYGHTTEGQTIDLDPGMNAGDYCLRSQFDPDFRFVEQNEANNMAEQRYEIDPEAGTVNALPAGPCNVPASPDTTIAIGPNDGSQIADTTPIFIFESSEGSSTFECRVDYGEWTACASPHTTEDLALGEHIFLVRAVGPVGFDDVPATRLFTVGEAPPPDTTPPETQITAGPHGKTLDRTPTFRFRPDEPSTFECRRDARRWRACFSPRTYHRLDLGTHQFRVRATDLAGNVELGPALRRFRTDATN